MASNSSPLSRSFLNVILVLIESILTLVLRFDANLRRAVYPLAKAETLVCIRTYLPHAEIYATFSYKGILLDNELPNGRTHADITINAYSFQLFNAMLMHDINHINALQMRGDEEKITLIKTFLAQIGIARIFNNIINKIKGANPTPEEKQTQKEDKVSELKNQLQEKTALAERLTSENQKLITQVAELKSRQKTANIALVVFALIAIVAIIMNFV